MIRGRGTEAAEIRAISSPDGNPSGRSMSPIFILGNIGSGTTVLHRTLLEAIESATDVDFSDQESRPFWMRHGMECGSPLTGTFCRAAGPQSLTEDNKAGIRERFRRICARGQRVFTKNPHFCNKVPLLHNLFPEARFIHIVRQDLSVVATMKKKFVRFHEGDTPWQTSCVHYWPEEESACWSVLSRSAPTRWQILREKFRRLLHRRGWVMDPAFADWTKFKKEHPDPTRYYPGEGFARLEEAWIKSNLAVVRDVENLGLSGRYLALNYRALVEQPDESFSRVADFLQVKYRPEFSFQSLRPDRQDKWRRDLTEAEVDVCRDQRRVFQPEIDKLTEGLPGPLLAD